jgi:hypothetical protein
MTSEERTRSNYLPKRIRACPQCRRTANVQIIIYGMPAVPPTPEEKDRVMFAGCVMSYETPTWWCQACEVAYTAKGEVVADFEA